MTVLEILNICVHGNPW